MSLDDWWRQVEHHFDAKAWNGVLVCADGLQEAGEERLAGCLRWMIKRDLRVNWVANGYQTPKWFYCYVYDSKFEDSTVESVINKVQVEREYYQ